METTGSQMVMIARFDRRATYRENSLLGVLNRGRAENRFGLSLFLLAHCSQRKEKDSPRNFHIALPQMSNLHPEGGFLIHANPWA